MYGFARGMRKVTSAGRLIGIPAAILAGWIAVVALVASKMATPVPLEAAIEQVLATSLTENAPHRLPATPPAVAAHKNRSGHAG